MRAIHNPIQPLAICNHSLFQIDRCPSQWITLVLQCLSTFTNTNLSDHRPLSPSPKSQPSNTTVIKIFTIDHTNTTIFFNHLNLPLTDVYMSTLPTFIPFEFSATNDNLFLSTWLGFSFCLKQKCSFRCWLPLSFDTSV